jgi:predicted nucleic acid-binding protein
MGLILDSSTLVAVERKGKNARQVLADISDKIGETDVAISVVTLIELAHVAARADTPERKAKRQEFIQELLTVLPNHPITAAVALRAGLVDGEQQPEEPEFHSPTCYLDSRWCNSRTPITLSDGIDQIIL